MTKKRKSGCIRVERGNWVFRWRERVPESPKPKLQFRILGEVTAEHRRHKYKGTDKLYVPAEIQAAANAIITPLNDAEMAAAENKSRPAFVVYKIGQYVENIYFPAIAKAKKPSTQKGYRDIWRVHFKDKISDWNLHDFRIVDATHLWEQILKEKPDLTARTMYHIRFFLSAIFKFAKDRGHFIFPENPAKASIPDGLAGPKKTEAYKVDEVIRLLSVLTNPMHQALIALAFGGGLRKGELVAVRWENMRAGDKGETLIDIKESYWNGHFTKPKTEASVESIVVGEEFVTYIEAWREVCGGVTEGLMFPGAGSRPVDLHNLEARVLKPVLNYCSRCKEENDVIRGRSAHAKENERKKQPNEYPDHDYVPRNEMPEWKGWHAFRRGNATLLANALNKEVAALMLRHEGSGVTDKHYILSDTKKQDQRADAAARESQRELQRSEAASTISDAMRKGRVN